MKDQTAAMIPRKDIRGVMCGLVKVQLKEPESYHEQWNLMWNVGSAVEVVKFAVINVSDYKDDGMKVACRLFITEDGERIWSEDFNIYMIQENGKWVAKDIEHGESAMESMVEDNE